MMNHQHFGNLRNEKKKSKKLQQIQRNLEYPKNSRFTRNLKKFNKFKKWQNLCADDVAYIKVTDIIKNKEIGKYTIG